MMLVIYGPTATGKTDLAIELAKKFDGELISADSRQVYKGLDIGTGKVSFDSKIEKHKGFWIVNRIKIRGFDLVNSGQRFSAADFLKFATTSVIQITEEKKLPIIVGGTGFYIRALIDGIESMGVKPDWNLRRQLEKLSVSKLYQKLARIDPSRAKSMNESDSKNPRRLIRAIEIAIYNKKHKTRQRRGSPEAAKNQKLTTKPYPLDTLILGLTAPNDYLYAKADQWLSERLSHDMINEIKSLLDQKVSPQWLESLGLECRWISRYLSDKISQREAINRLRGDVHSFIRRQKTWFRKFPQIRLFDISKPNWQRELKRLVSHPV